MQATKQSAQNADSDSELASKLGLQAYLWIIELQTSPRETIPTDGSSCSARLHTELGYLKNA